LDTPAKRPVSETVNLEIEAAMRKSPVLDAHLGRQLVLDELFDLSLYRRLRTISGPAIAKTLDELIVVEARHFAFWQEFFNLRLSALNFGRRVKLSILASVCRLFGPSSIDLILEAIEVYGIRKYLSLWEQYRDTPLAEAVRGILEDEFEHEDEVVTRLNERIINPDRVRNIFLGLNDGMVEILGAVSGFFASFGQNSLVLLAGLTTAVAGSLSMAAGVYVATSSENEVRRTQDEKMRFIGERSGPLQREEPAITSGIIVGISYFAGAAFPLLPVFFGARGPVYSVITGGSMILLVSLALAFLSGMEIKKRALTNLVLIAVAVGVSYAIGLAVRAMLGVQI
jgi:predicted membrane protein (TIGR00267 family)